ncbi:hypothetical protein ACHAW6_008695 [Cyclotella cf. meneghiniana]
MKVYQHAIAFILSVVLSPKQVTPAVTVGDEICITGYVVDNFCIELGNLLDNPSVKTLEHPEVHSFHCLLDVESCRNGGYQVLGEKNQDTGMHCLGFRLNDTDAVVAAGQSFGRNGSCMSCAGNSSAPEYGWLATVKGNVMELGDGSNGIFGTPILNNVELLSSDVECNTTTVPPLCVVTAPTPPSPTSSPAAPSPGVSSGGSELHVIMDYILSTLLLMHLLMH